MNVSKLSRLLKGGLVLGGAAFVAVYLITALQRLSYPYELEWMEGGMVDHVRRILAGDRVYIEPSLEFSPYGYGPVYLWASAAISPLVGEGFFPLRLVSFLASVGTLLVIFDLVRRETRNATAAFLGASLFAVTFEKSGFFFDVARVDSLFVFLLMLTLAMTRRARSTRSAVGVGALFALLVFTKQVVLPLVPFVGLYFFLVHRRLAVPFASAFLLLGGAAYWVLDLLNDGWASFYLFGFHAGRAVIAHRILFFLRDMAYLALPAALGVVFLTRKFRRRSDVPAGSFYLAVSLGLFGAVGYSRSLELGAFTNVYMPAHALLAVFFGLGYSEVQHYLESTRSRVPALLFFTACIIQFGSLSYDFTSQLPTREDRAAGDELIALVKQIDGPVWLIDHGYLAALAGKQTSIHTVSTLDSVRNERTRPYTERAVLAGLRDEHYEAIFMSDKTYKAMAKNLPGMVEELERHYTVVRSPVFEEPRVFLPVTGVPMRPDRMYRRKP